MGRVASLISRASALRQGPDAGHRQPRGNKVLRPVGHHGVSRRGHQSPIKRLTEQNEGAKALDPRQISE